MTDYERIKNWLEEYYRVQKLRDMNEAALLLMVKTCDDDPQRKAYFTSMVDGYNKHLKLLRERIMIYGDY